MVILGLSRQAMITTTNLIKRYGSLEVLNGISLAVARGEVAAIVGPSGGGKSTFLRCLNGLETFQDGSVEVAGLQLTPALAHRERKMRLGQLRQRVGMVFQQFNLFPHRTVLGNIIEAPMHVLGQSRDEAEATARQLLDRVGLAAKLNAMPDTLSGGQQQRVAIARALAMRPQAVLFDEPTSALDPRMAAEVESVIADLASDSQTMIVVTHSMRLARRAANTLYVFEGGRILESGSPEQVFDHPHEQATRQFLADVNGK
jgi:ABC-type polar amino acid transport system ATPase subunit